MVESRINFVRVAEYRQIFLRPDMSSYAAENSNHIQPQVVLLCEHNTIMRIYTKIQLILESNLDFQDLCQYLPNVPKNRSTTNGRILGQFCADDKMQTIFLRSWHFSVHTGKQRTSSTTGCILFLNTIIKYI